MLFYSRNGYNFIANITLIENIFLDLLIKLFFQGN